MRSRAELETDLTALQSQTRLKRLTRLRREALEHLAATLLQERLGRARRDSFAKRVNPSTEKLPKRQALESLQDFLCFARLLIFSRGFAWSRVTPGQKALPKRYLLGKSDRH
jgi:hypothetical protein